MCGKLGGVVVELKLITENKKQFLPLLLLGDEQESMIDAYLERGALYALYDGDKLCGVIVVTCEGEKLFEIKNMAVAPHLQRRGYGRFMLKAIRDLYARPGAVLQVGTGETPATLNFYQACGFQISHRVPDFFLQYDHPIYEDGVFLRDMIYLQQKL